MTDAHLDISCLPIENGIQRNLLPEVVADHLRDMIVENVLLPGTRIRERTITEVLKVSRTPLREALRMLAAEGLVELLPNRGAVVANPTLEEVHEMLQVQTQLEDLAAYQFCERASDADIDAIRALHHEMLVHFYRGERLPYYKINQRIHRRIIEAAGNNTLATMHGILNARLYRFRYQPNLQRDHWQTAIDEHEEILHAVESRNGDRLRDVLKAHLASTWEKILAVSEDGTLRDQLLGWPLSEKAGGKPAPHG